MIVASTSMARFGSMRWLSGHGLPRRWSCGVLAGALCAACGNAPADEFPAFEPAQPVQPAPAQTPEPVNPGPATPAPVSPPDRVDEGPPAPPLDAPPDETEEDEAGDPVTPPGVVAASCAPWPASTGTEQVSETIEVSGTFDGELKRFVGTGDLGSGGQDEDQPTFFALEDGAVLRNVILGFPAADGIHCEGQCRLENVWWEDVGEDAATFQTENDDDVMTVSCGGARAAADKVFQHNGAGTLIIEDFFAEGFGKLYRSCGNCGEQYERHVEIRRVEAENGGTLAGINENFGDTASFEDIAADSSVTICERFRGNDTGAEPVSLGEGPDAEHCLYQSGDIQSL